MYVNMLISLQHKFIFIRIYKTASTSIREALTPFAMKEDNKGCPPHISASEIINMVGKEIFDMFYSFAVVRNPWDWQTSEYEFLLRATKHQHHKLVQDFGGFDRYIQWRVENIQLQKSFIYSGKGELLVDFVGRFENIEDDFKTICSRIGITAPPLPRLQVTIGKKPYREYYTPETEDLVRQAYKDDIATFGYGPL